MHGDLVGDAALADLLAVREAEVFGRRHVAEERGAVGRRRRRTDRAHDVVVAGRDVGRHGAEDVERRLPADLLLARHVHLDLVERHMAGPLHHHLHTARAAAVDELAEDVQLAELRGVGGVREAAGAHAVAERDGDIVRGEDRQHLVPVRIERIFDLVLHHPLGHDRAAARDDTHDALHRGRDVPEEKACVKRHEVNALLGLCADDVEEEGRIHLRDVAFEARDRLVDGNRAERFRARVEHTLADCLEIIRADGEIHHEVSARVERDPELFEFVPLPRVRHAAAEVRVDLRREHPPHAHGVAVRVVDVERNHRLARRNGGAHGLRVQPLVRRDDLHRLSHDALPGGFQLRHLSSPCGQSEWWMNEGKGRTAFTPACVPRSARCRRARRS